MLLALGMGRLPLLLLFWLLLMLLLEVRPPLRLAPEEDDEGGVVGVGYSILIACLACALPVAKPPFFIPTEEDKALKDWDLFMVVVS